MPAKVLAINAPPRKPVALTAISTHPVEAYLSRLGEGSRRAVLVALDGIAEFLGRTDAHAVDWAELRYPDTLRIRTYLADNYSRRTANFGICALRGVLKECWRLGLIVHADYARAIDLSRVRGDETVAGRVLFEAELAALFNTCLADRSPAGIRDAAIIGVLYGTGLRRSELVGLDVADYSKGVLTVRGKGNKVRLAYVVGKAQTWLDDWVTTRGQSEGPLFVPVMKGGRVCIARLTGGGLWQILKSRAKEAGVPAFSPHDLRRTTATHLLERGVDIAVVKNLLGHAHLSTTILYDRRGESTKKVATSKLQC